jgi:hypothetical protein
MSIFKVVKVGCMALAALGLAACSSGSDTSGVVDEFQTSLTDCSDFNEGEHLSARAVVDGTDLIITVSSGGDGPWLDLPRVTEVMGATLEEVAVGQNQSSINLSLTLDTPDTMSGSFVFRGTLNSLNAGVCRIERSFSFIIGNDHVEVARRYRDLPLSAPGREALAISRPRPARSAILLSAARLQMPVVPS